jgi:zinc transporter 9
MIPKRLHIRDGGEDGYSLSSKSGGGIAGLNAVLGLVIHGAADGIAIGASSLSSKGNLGLIVFLAVLVHKGASTLPRINVS